MEGKKQQMKPKRVGWVMIPAKHLGNAYPKTFTTDAKQAKRWRALIEGGYVEEVFPVARIEQNV